MIGTVETRDSGATLWLTYKSWAIEELLLYRDLCECAQLLKQNWVLYSFFIEFNAKCLQLKWTLKTKILIKNLIKFTINKINSHYFVRMETIYSPFLLSFCQLSNNWLKSKIPSSNALKAHYLIKWKVQQFCFFFIIWGAQIGVSKYEVDYIQ
jgi:hypothetical protein